MAGLSAMGLVLVIDHTQQLPSAGVGVRWGAGGGYEAWWRGDGVLGRLRLPAAPRLLNRAAAAPIWVAGPIGGPSTQRGPELEIRSPSPLAASVVRAWAWDPAVAARSSRRTAAQRILVVRESARGPRTCRGRAGAAVSVWSVPERGKRLDWTGQGAIWAAEPR